MGVIPDPVARIVGGIKRPTRWQVLHPRVRRQACMLVLQANTLGGIWQGKLHLHRGQGVALVDQQVLRCRLGAHCDPHQAFGAP